MMLPTKFRVCLLIGLILFYPVVVMAQVPVREEPRHHPALQNKYFRLLDVWLPPGDTTLFHIHATPSVFVMLTSTLTGSQTKGEGWTSGVSAAGTAWYRSFSPDTIVHRVCNLDSTTYHVNDIELLSMYDSGHTLQREQIPFKLLFENERALAWQLISHPNSRQTIRDRGPMIAELVSGEGILFHDTTTGQSQKILPGKFLYIAPGTSFYFTDSGAGKMNMVLFEIK